MDTSYYKKYLKYKEKYLKLKFQQGGVITKTVITRDMQNNYVVLLDNHIFLKFHLSNVNLSQLDNYVKVSCQNQKPIYDYINANLTEKFVYLSNFYTLSIEEHRKINENIKKEKKEKIEQVKDLETKIFDNEVKIKSNTHYITTLGKFNLLLKKNNDTEKLQINTKQIDDKTAENLLLNQTINKLKLELSQMQSKQVNISIFDTTDITTNDIKGIAGQVLLYVLNSLYGDEINLCLEPVLGDSPRAVSYANMDKTDDQRYADLIKYYDTVLYKSTNVKSNSKTTFEQFNELGKYALSYERTFKRIFMIGKVDLKDIRTIVAPETYNTIELVKWGFGIENEVGVIAGQTDTKLLTHNAGEKVGYVYSKNFNDLIAKTNNYVLKQKIKKILSNTLAYLEGNSSSDVMLESTTIIPINMTLNDYITEINDERNGNLEAYNKIFESSVKYYNGEPYQYLSNNETNHYDYHYDYLGSYHFNITLPHSQNISIAEPDEVFLKRHLNYARLLQWFEPLLLAVYGQPDYRSIYDKKKYSQASYRLFNSKTMFINTSDLTTNIPSSREILETNKPLLEKRDQFINAIKQELSYDFIDIRGFDFRRAKYEVGKEYKSKYYGFEFRLMDYFPVENLKQFSELLWLLAFKMDTCENGDIENAAYNDIVIEQIKYIINSGWNAEICDSYCQKMQEICTKIGLAGEIDNSNAYEMLNSIYTNLIRNYNNYNFNTNTNNVINSYNVILGNLTIRMLDCPNKIAKNKLIEYQINLLFNNNKNLEGQNRKSECQSVESLKDILSEMCAIYMSYGEMNDEKKKDFKKQLIENKYLVNCFLNNPDDIDIDNIYYYLEYIYTAGKCL
jgi:hypothetical protein